MLSTRTTRPSPASAGRTALSTGKPYEIEYRIRGQDGRYRWFLGRALPIRDSVRRDPAVVRHLHGHRPPEEGRGGPAAPRRATPPRPRGGRARHLGSASTSGDRSAGTRGPAPCSGSKREGHPQLSRSRDPSRGFIRERPRAGPRAARGCADPHAEGRFDAEYRIVLADGNMRWLRSQRAGHSLPAKGRNGAPSGCRASSATSRSGACPRRPSSS